MTKKELPPVWPNTKAIFLMPNNPTAKFSRARSLIQSRPLVRWNAFCITDEFTSTFVRTRGAHFHGGHRRHARAHHCDHACPRLTASLLARRWAIAPRKPQLDSQVHDFLTVGAALLLCSKPARLRCARRRVLRQTGRNYARRRALAENSRAGGFTVFNRARVSIMTDISALSDRNRALCGDKRCCVREIFVEEIGVPRSWFQLL